MANDEFFDDELGAHKKAGRKTGTATRWLSPLSGKSGTRVVAPAEPYSADDRA